MKQLFIFTAFLCSSLYGEATYIYHKSTAGKKSETVWTLNTDENALHITGESVTGKTVIITSPDRVTQSFNYMSKNQEDEYTIFRDGPYLVARKKVDGQMSEKLFEIGHDLWIQEFDFSLKPFISSDKGDIKFSIIHPKNLSQHRMIATKQHLEEIQLYGKVYRALKVKVTLAGLFERRFWHADLWFDPESGDLLLSEAPEGLKAPISTITLFSKELTDPSH